MLLVCSAGRLRPFVLVVVWVFFQNTSIKRKRLVAEKLHSWLHLWITGLQDAQAKPFKPGYNFAAVNVS